MGTGVRKRDMRASHSTINILVAGHLHRHVCDVQREPLVAGKHVICVILHSECAMCVIVAFVVIGTDGGDALRGARVDGFFGRAFVLCVCEARRRGLCSSKQTVQTDKLLRHHVRARTSKAFIVATISIRYKLSHHHQRSYADRVEMEECSGIDSKAHAAY